MKKFRHREKTRAVLTLSPVADQIKPDVPLDALDRFASKHNLAGVYLFGSILTQHFHAGSDVDVMIDTGTHMPSYFETCRMTDELEVLFTRPVDLLIKSTVEHDKNPYRRNAILGKAQLMIERLTF